jgi:hypothetical protein
MLGEEVGEKLSIRIDTADGQHAETFFALGSLR